jgi:hypothetical protein
MPRKKKEYVPHDRFDPKHPLLRELVSVHFEVANGTPFDANLTRIPCVGEEVFKESACFRVLRVQHTIVDDDGRAFAGYHAYVEAVEVPE